LLEWEEGWYRLPELSWRVQADPERERMAPLELEVDRRPRLLAGVRSAFLPEEARNRAGEKSEFEEWVRAEVEQKERSFWVPGFPKV